MVASLHNRFLVALGKQPTCTEIFDEHIRAFTPRTLIKFLTFNDLFREVKFRGVGFYPLIPPFSNILSRVFQKASVIMMILLRKNHFENPVTWQDEVGRIVKQTNY